MLASSTADLKAPSLPAVGRPQSLRMAGLPGS